MAYTKITSATFAYAILIMNSFCLYISFFNRFRKRQDTKVGLSNSAKMARRKQNLVSMQFNMINWLLETVSLFLVIFEDYEFFTILYLLVTSCGAPLVYYLGIEDNRRKAREYFQSRIRIFRKKVAPAPPISALTIDGNKIHCLTKTNNLV